MLELYDLRDPDLVAVLTEAARGSRGQPWWSAYRDSVSPQFATYLGHESQAAVFRIFHPFLVPALLHTEEYTRALLGDYSEPARAKQMLDLRMERQERLFARAGVTFSFVMGEEALCRWIGGPRVMRHQLEHVLDIAERPGVSVRIVPFKAGSHPGLRGPIILLRLEESDEDMLFLESVSGDQLLRDDPEKISEYAEYFEVLTGLSLAAEEGNSLLKGQISRLRQAEQEASGQAVR
jgi:hypothetical protein